MSECDHKNQNIKWERRLEDSHLPVVPHHLERTPDLVMTHDRFCPKWHGENFKYCVCLIVDAVRTDERNKAIQRFNDAIPNLYIKSTEIPLILAALDGGEQE